MLGIREEPGCLGAGLQLHNRCGNVNRKCVCYDRERKTSSRLILCPPYPPTPPAGQARWTTGVVLLGPACQLGCPASRSQPATLLMHLWGALGLHPFPHQLPCPSTPSPTPANTRRSQQPWMQQGWGLIDAPALRPLGSHLHLPRAPGRSRAVPLGLEGASCKCPSFAHWPRHWDALPRGLVLLSA